MSLLLFSLSGPSFAKKKIPPLGGSCTTIETADDFTLPQYLGQPKAQAVFGFIDQGNGDAEAALRGEFQCPSTHTTPGSEPPMALCTDVILKRSGGQQYRVKVDFDDISEFDKYVPVHVNPDQDALFLIAHPVTQSPEFDSQHWLVMLDVPTCTWIGMLMDYHAHSLKWPTIVQRLRMDDPRLQAEAAFLEKEKFRDGYFTPDILAKVRTNPQNSKYVWLLDNPEIPSGAAQGTLHLQWYPCEAADCAPEKDDLLHGTMHLKGAPEVKMVNPQTQEWAWLFLPTQYDEDRSTTPAVLAGSQFVIKTSSRRLVLQLDNLTWTQEASAQIPSPSVPDVTASSETPAAPAVSSAPAVSTAAVQDTPSLAPATPTAVTTPPSALDDVVMTEETGGQIMELEEDAALDGLLAIRSSVSTTTVQVSTAVAVPAVKPLPPAASTLSAASLPVTVVPSTGVTLSSSTVAASGVSVTSMTVSASSIAVTLPPLTLRPTPPSGIPVPKAAPVITQDNPVLDGLLAPAFSSSTLTGR